jgi:hypothetical protein
MMKIKYLVFAVLTSLVLYTVIFVFIVHKPLTVGVMQEYYAKKLSYLESIDDRKIVLLAGSNGRFSHRCETMEPLLGMPCSNMSVSADLSLDYQLDIIKPYLNADDIVYLPLEFGALSGTKQEVMAGAEQPYVVAYDHDYLKGMGVERLVYALFYFDLKFLISGLGEMLLDGMHVKRRFSPDTLTRQGDESGHALEKGSPYREQLASLEWSPPAPGDFSWDSFKAGLLGDFLDWAAERNIQVIGGLPTTFDDEPVPDEFVARLCAWYRQHGQGFMVLENQSRYPRSSFYDTPYHLVEEQQIRHSRLVAGQLGEITGRSPNAGLSRLNDVCTTGVAH